jgi:hypothetical protein
VTGEDSEEEFPHVFLNINRHRKPPGMLVVGGVDISSIARVLSVVQDTPGVPARIELHLYVANGAVTMDGRQVYPPPTATPDPEGGDPG